MLDFRGGPLRSHFEVRCFQKVSCWCTHTWLRFRMVVHCLSWRCALGERGSFLWSAYLMQFCVFLWLGKGWWKFLHECSVIVSSLIPIPVEETKHLSKPGSADLNSCDIFLAEQITSIPIATWLSAIMFFSHCMFYSTSFNDTAALKLVTFVIRKPNLIYCFWFISRVGEEGGLVNQDDR